MDKYGQIRELTDAEPLRENEISLPALPDRFKELVATVALAEEVPFVSTRNQRRLKDKKALGKSKFSAHLSSKSLNG